MRVVSGERSATIFSCIAGTSLLLMLFCGAADAETFDRSICVSPSHNDQVVQEASDIKSRLPQFDLVGFRVADLSLRTLVKEKIRKFGDFISVKTACSDGKCTIQIDGGKVQGQIRTGEILECFSTVKSCTKNISDCDTEFDEYVETVYWPGGILTMRQSRLSHESAAISSDMTARTIWDRHSDPKDNAGIPVYSDVFDLDRRNSLAFRLMGKQ